MVPGKARRAIVRPHLEVKGDQMGPSSSNRRRPSASRNLKLTVTTLLAVLATTLAAAQDKDLLLPGVPYVCNGERMFIENCNMRDTSDTSTCMVGHPDQVLPNGLMKYTTETRGTLKKLFPTCTQPSAKQIAAAQAFQKKQQDTYNANVAKANQQMAAPQPNPNGQPGATGPIAPPEERRRTRDAPLRQLRQTSSQLHRQSAVGRLRPDAQLGRISGRSRLDQRRPRIRPHHGRSLRRPRQLAP